MAITVHKEMSWRVPLGIHYEECKGGEREKLNLMMRGATEMVGKFLNMAPSIRPRKLKER